MRQNARNDGKPFLASYVLQSKLSQQQRQRAADRFREAKTGILFSSDVTARGMDFPNVTHVIQIDTPRDRESYIHRLGRTGRQNKEGQGWLILPHSSVRPARKMLQGLPIAQNSTLESAETDVENGESTPYHESTKALFSVIPRDLLSQTYTSMFGLATDKVETAEDVNKWTKYGWGWDVPPYVSSMWVNKMGLSRASGMNIRERDNFSDSRGGFSNDRRGGDRGGDRGGRSSRDQRSSDPFDNMAANVRRDDYGRGGNRTGGFGGSRGFGGRDGGRGRTGGRGFGGRDRDSRSSF
jgi:ATP-dependent RNA helicase MSS116